MAEPSLVPMAVFGAAKSAEHGPWREIPKKASWGKGK
jgi:hypothetical protein